MLGVTFPSRLKCLCPIITCWLTFLFNQRILQLLQLCCAKTVTVIGGAKCLVGSAFINETLYILIVNWALLAARMAS